MSDGAARRKPQSQVHPFPRKPTLPNGCEAELLNLEYERLIRRREQQRWLLAATAVLSAYAGGLAWWLHTPSVSSAPTPPAAAMVIELAPAPVSPVSEPDLPPSPEPTPEIAPKPTPQPEPKPETPPPPVIEPEVALPEPEPTPPQDEIEPQPEETPDQAPSTASAPTSAPIKDERAAAPNQGVSASLIQANRAPRWRDQLLMALNNAKRYPFRARRLRQEGISYLRFVMDREGNVMEYSVARSSGHELLDQETMELIQRAQPLPKPPEQVEGATLEFVIPVEFFLNR